MFDYMNVVLNWSHHSSFLWLLSSGLYMILSKNKIDNSYFPLNKKSDKLKIVENFFRSPQYIFNIDITCWMNIFFWIAVHLFKEKFYWSKYREVLCFFFLNIFSINNFIIKVLIYFTGGPRFWQSGISGIFRKSF